MDIQPIDLTAILGMLLGTSIVIIPLLGLTARFALKPLVESLGRVFQSSGSEASVRILERRMALLEQHLESMDATMTRLAEAAEFDRELHGGTPTALPLGGAATERARPGDRRP